MAVEPGLERAPGLAPLQKHVCARCQTEKALRRQCDIVTLTNQRRETADGRGKRLLHILIREAEGILGHQERRGQRDGQGASEQNLAKRAPTSRHRRANQPQVSLPGACTAMPVKSIRPCVGPDAVKAAKSSTVRAPSRPYRCQARKSQALGGHGRGRSARRAALARGRAPPGSTAYRHARSRRECRATLRRLSSCP